MRKLRILGIPVIIFLLSTLIHPLHLYNPTVDQHQSSVSSETKVLMEDEYRRFDVTHENIKYKKPIVEPLISTQIGMFSLSLEELTANKNDDTDCNSNTDVKDKSIKGKNKKNNKENTKKKEPVFQFTNNEINILEKIVEAEVTGGSIDAKCNVASVIINRVESESFPDTIKDVVFQKTGGIYQFSPIADGRYYSVKVTDNTKKAVKEIVDNGTTTPALYFFNIRDISGKNKRWINNKLIFLFKDDVGHSFYIEKEEG